MHDHPGTCGFGCLGELWGRNGRLKPRPLAPGDEVTLSVEGIGTLTNRIVAGVDPGWAGHPVSRARARQGASVSGMTHAADLQASLDGERRR